MRWRRVVLAALLILVALGLPDAVAAPVRVSVTRVPQAEAVDFQRGVTWVLVAGSDARPGTDVREGNTDALQLVGMDFATRAASLIGIPRDSLVPLPDGGFDRINAALADGGQDRLVAGVEYLTRIRPSYVVLVGMAEFEALVDSLGGLTVIAPSDVSAPQYPLEVVKGPNDFDGRQALDYARVREELDGDDFERSINHQRLLRAILRKAQSRQDEVGFLETQAAESLGMLDTDLAPDEFYRLASAALVIDLMTVTNCVLLGRPETLASGAEVIVVDRVTSYRIGRDAEEDGRIDQGCWPTPAG